VLILGIIVTVICFAVGTPLFAAMGIGSAIIALWHFGFPVESIGSFILDGLDSFPLLALPLFVWMGELFVRSGAAKHVIELAEAIFGRIPGGMGIATVVSAVFFSAICGSATATITTIGIIMVPTLIAQKYDRGLAGMTVAAAGDLGNLVPPSLFFIIYGSLMELDISALYAAGFVPGFLVAAGLAGAVVVGARNDERRAARMVAGATGASASSRTSPGDREIGRKLVKALPALLMPAVVLGGIYAGLFTPTEAAAVGCFLVLVVGVVVYREAGLREIWDSLTRSATTIGAIMIMIAGGILLGRMFVVAGFPDAVTTLVVQANMSPAMFLVAACATMIVLGIFMESILMVYICGPLFVPTVIALGLSPIHFGVVLVTSVLIGQITPPMAEGIFVSSAATGIPATDITKRVPLFIGVQLVTLVFIVAFPGISLSLPKLLGMPGF
jgi:C4-dicarboxylate transporter, DctM subunit